MYTASYSRTELRVSLRLQGGTEQQKLQPAYQCTRRHIPENWNFGHCDGGALSSCHPFNTIKLVVAKLSQCREINNTHSCLSKSAIRKLTPVYSTEHSVQYTAQCAVQSTVCSTEHSEQYTAQCAVQSTVYSTEHSVQCRAQCAVQSTVCSTEHSVQCRAQ